MKDPQISESLISLIDNLTEAVEQLTKRLSRCETLVDTLLEPEMNLEQWREIVSEQEYLSAAGKLEDAIRVADKLLNRAS